MLRPVILSVLAVCCFATSCPQIKTSSNFDPKAVVGRWEILLHTNASEEARGCCKCVHSIYSEKDGLITSLRKGIATDGSFQRAITGLRPIEGSLYTHFIKADDDWVKTGSNVAVYSTDKDCLGFFACQPVQESLLNNAVFMCRSHTDIGKAEGFKAWLTSNGIKFDRFIEIDHSNCDHKRD